MPIPPTIGTILANAFCHSYILFFDDGTSAKQDVHGFAPTFPNYLGRAVIIRQDNQDSDYKGE